MARRAPTAYEADKVGLGVALATLRRSRSLTQEELAERIGIRSAAAISRIESGNGPLPREATLNRLALALDLNETEAGELFALAGAESPIRRSPYADAVRGLLADCAEAVERPKRTLTPLDDEELFAAGRVLERFDVAEGAVNLLRVLAGTGRSRGSYALGISLAGADDFFEEEQQGRWEAALQLVMGRGLPVVEVFELEEPEDAIATVRKVLRRLASDPPGAYHARYFKSAPVRASVDCMMVAPGLGGLLFLNSRDSAVVAGPDTAYTFREGPGLSMLGGRFERLWHQESKRLLKVLAQNWEEAEQRTSPDHALEWESDLARDEESLGDRLQVTKGLSRLLVPDHLWIETVAEAWKGHDISGHRIHRYDGIRQRRRVAFESQMGRFRYRTISTRDAVEGLVRGDATTIDTMLGGPEKKPLPLLVRRRAIETLLDYLEHGFELALLEDREPSQIPIFEWIVKDTQAVYLEARSEQGDVLRVTLLAPMLIDAFKDFFDDVWQHLPAPATDQARVGDYLRAKLAELAQ